MARSVPTITVSDVVHRSFPLETPTGCSKKPEETKLVLCTIPEAVCEDLDFEAVQKEIDSLELGIDTSDTSLFWKDFNFAKTMTETRLVVLKHADPSIVQFRIATIKQQHYLASLRCSWRYWTQSLWKSDSAAERRYQVEKSILDQTLQTSLAVFQP